MTGLNCNPTLLYGGLPICARQIDVVREVRARYGADESFAEDLFDLLDRRWTIHVIRVLAQGKRRFSEIASAKSINSNTLACRLKELSHAGLVVREVHSYIPPHVEYRLTVKGKELVEALEKVGELAERWGTLPEMRRGFALVAETRRPMRSEAKKGPKGGY
ncbi:MAG: helix-turn-helix transcriptional regulator [Armatimonadetes bacterium]|nr:helix-turn-helix transcriptional regulator [Armatimonadota bacterium]